MGLFRVLICVAALWPGSGLAQSYPVAESVTVTDRAEVLGAEAEAALVQRLEALRAETGVEFAIVTLPSQAPFAPDQTLEQFATGLFDHWGIGDAEVDSGILLLVLPEDRAVRIELGAGYGRRWDGTARDIVERDLLPQFRAGDYEAGIVRGADAVIVSIAEPFASDQPPPEDSAQDGLPPVILAIMAACAGIAVFGRRLSDRVRRCPSCGRRGGVRRRRETLVAATRSSEGEEEVFETCRNCDHRGRFRRTLPVIRRSSSSGFGGGRSGGGGASGRW